MGPAGTNLNLPLPLGSDDAVWLDAIDHALDRIAGFAPGALVLALGLDAHENDPFRGLRVTTPGFARAAARIRAAGLPTVIVQEGGYLSEDLTHNLASFLRAGSAPPERSIAVRERGTLMRICIINTAARSAARASRWPPWRRTALPAPRTICWGRRWRRPCRGRAAFRHGTAVFG